MSDQGKLIATLRNIEAYGCANFKSEHVDKTCGDAADEIASLLAQDEAWMTTARKQEEELVSLRAQRDNAVEGCDVALARVLELEAQLASARKALEKIAATKDNGPEWAMAGLCQRIAQAALKTEQGNSK